MAVCGRCFVCGQKLSCRNPIKCESCAEGPEEMPAVFACPDQSCLDSEHKICAGCLRVLHGQTFMGDEEGRGVAVTLLDRLYGVLVEGAKK